MKSITALPIVLIILLALCCCAIIGLSALGYGVYTFRNNIPTFVPYTDDSTPTPFEITIEPVDPNAVLNLERIEQTVVPQRDLAELACRFNSVCNVPETLAPPETPYAVGEEKQFWLNNSDDGSYTRITATLVYLTPHAYFWVENGVSFKQSEAEELIDTFEEQIYPTNRAFFGSEWTPGVDNDPHIYIIYARDLGGNAAGFYVSIDEYNPLVVEHSNGIEAFYIDSEQRLNDEYTYSTLAHEFQHMIHWYQDANESSFLDEGFAELATFLNGYDPGGWDWYYTNDPDIALTDWGSGDNGVHYGANFLFVTYFLDRFGDQATQALIHDPQNELESVDNTLASQAIMDPLTSLPITADDFFLDWVLANYIHDEDISDGRYFYHLYPNSPTTADTEILSACPQDKISRTVNQYGVDYIRISCPGDHTIYFNGATVTPLLPDDPHSGEYAFWSNKANDSNTSLTRTFDLSGTSAPVTLTYWTWFDLEDTFDYVYLEASPDGVNLEILPTPSGTGDDPTGSSFGWGYTGVSEGWVQESVDLSQFAGQSVTLRFDYITDAAVINEGLLLDDISIPAINYFEDFEAGDGDWEASGFVRVQNILPQYFRLAMIRNTGNETTVEILAIRTDQAFEIPFTNNGGDSVVLVVTATTRFTHALAPYQLEIR